MNRVTFKVTLQRQKAPNTTHRFRGAYTFDEVQSVVAHLWGNGNHFRFTYEDTDGDTITVLSQMEWEEAIRLHSLSVGDDTSKPLKLYAMRPVGKPGKKDSKKESRALKSDDDMSEGEAEATVSVVPSVNERAASAVPALNIPPRAEGDAQAHVPEEPARVADAVSQPSAHLVCDTDKDHTAMAVISAIIEADAVECLIDPLHAFDFRGTVKRTFDPTNGEIHIDVDLERLRRESIAKSVQLMNDHKFHDAKNLLIKAGLLFESDAIIEYNLACAVAQLATSDSERAGAVFHLENSVSLGYRNGEHIRSDDDLAPLHGVTAFNDVLAKLGVAPIEQQSRQTSQTQSRNASSVGPQPSASAAEEPIQVSVPRPSVDPKVATLLTVFPYLTDEEAKSALATANGVVAIAVNRFLQ